MQKLDESFDQVAATAALRKTLEVPLEGREAIRQTAVAKVAYDAYVDAENAGVLALLKKQGAGPPTFENLSTAVQNAWRNVAAAVHNFHG